jgi:hypothetical protein
MRLTASGNLGLGVTPSASNWATFELLGGNTITSYPSATIPALYSASNAYYNSGWIYKSSNNALMYAINAYSGQFQWFTAPSGTAGNAISFTQAMTLGANSGLSIGTTTAASANGLLVAGVAIFNGKTNIVKSHSDYSFTVVNTDSNGYGMYLQAGSTNNAIDVFNAAGTTQIFKLTGTGAATFSSSVTAGGSITTNSGGVIIGTGSGSNWQVYKDPSTSFLGMYLSGASPFMVINSSGNVGIGTTSPADKLDVIGSVRVSSANFFRYDGDVGLIGSGTSIGGGTVSQLGIRAASDILFATNGANERMRITSGGNVEINTGSIKTGEPDTGWGRAAIKIGASVSGEAFDVTRYLPVSVDGTVYYINLNSSTP